MNKASGLYDPMPLLGKSLMIMGPDSKVRIKAKKILLHPYFDNFIYALISASSILLALSEPYLTSYQDAALNIGHKIILILFIFEFIIKVVVSGFAVGKNAYLKSGWNFLDFFIIVVSVIDWILTESLDGSVSLSFLRALRALRALRPLRMVSRNEGMKKVVTSVM